MWPLCVYRGGSVRVSISTESTPFEMRNRPSTGCLGDMSVLCVTRSDARCMHLSGAAAPRIALGHASTAEIHRDVYGIRLISDRKIGQLQAHFPEAMGLQP